MPPGEPGSVLRGASARATRLSPGRSRLSPGDDGQFANTTLDRPSAVVIRVGGAITPALLISTSTGVLSRRAGLAKSNVLRYFESREAVLLELLDAAWQDWLVQLDQDLSAAVDRAAPITSRCDRLAAVVAASLAAQPMLCDLISAQAAVLERNVSAQVAAQYKRASMACIDALGSLMRRCVPELGEQDAVKLAGATIMTAGALWPHTQPSAAMLAAYEDDPELAAMRLDFTATIREVVEVVSAGLLAGDGRRERSRAGEAAGAQRDEDGEQQRRPGQRGRHRVL